MKDRVVWIDWAKSFGIFLVIYAHIPNAKFSELCFLFHMPFFFILSGLLYKKRSFKEELRRSFIYLYIPYLIYNILLIIITPPICLKCTFVNIVFGNQEQLPSNYRAMWFLVSLIIMRIISSIFDVKKMIFFSILGLFLSIVILFLGILDLDNDYFQLFTTLLCYHYFVFGFLMKENPRITLVNKIPFKKSVLSYIAGVFVFFIIGYCFVGEVNLFRNVAGKNVFLFVIVSYGIAFLLIELFKMLFKMNNTIIVRISTGTLLLVCIHQTLLYYLWPYFQYDDYISPFILTTLIIAISYLPILLCYKYFPLLIGKSLKK